MFRTRWILSVALCLFVGTIAQSADGESCVNPATFETKHREELKVLSDQLSTEEAEKRELRETLVAERARLTEARNSVTQFQERSDHFEQMAAKLQVDLQTSMDTANTEQKRAEQAEAELVTTRQALVAANEKVEAHAAAGDQQHVQCKREAEELTATAERWMENARQLEENSAKCVSEAGKLSADTAKCAAESKKLSEAVNACEVEKKQATTEAQKTVASTKGRLAEAKEALKEERAKHELEVSQLQRDRSLYSYDHHKRNNQDSLRIFRAIFSYVARLLRLDVAAKYTKDGMVKTWHSAQPLLATPKRDLERLRDRTMSHLTGGKIESAVRALETSAKVAQVEARKLVGKSQAWYRKDASGVLATVNVLIDLYVFRPFLSEFPDLAPLVPDGHLNRWFFVGYLAVWGALSMRFVCTLLTHVWAASSCIISTCLYYACCCCCCNLCGRRNRRRKCPRDKSVEKKRFEPAPAPGIRVEDDPNRESRSSGSRKKGKHSRQDGV